MEYLFWAVSGYLAVGAYKLVLVGVHIPLAYATWLYHKDESTGLIDALMYAGITVGYCLFLWPVSLWYERWMFFIPYSQEAVIEAVTESFNEFY